MTALVNRRTFGGNSLRVSPALPDPGRCVLGVAAEEIRERFLSALERISPTFGVPMARFDVSSAAT